MVAQARALHRGRFRLGARDRGHRALGPNGEFVGRSWRQALKWPMAKPTVPAALLKAIADANASAKGPAEKTKPAEASPKSGSKEIQSIRPARTAIAHQRGGNKGK